MEIVQKKVISVINRKGGVGKTSSTVNLAAAFSLKGRKSLIIDTDKQGNATQYVGMYDENMASMYNVFKGECYLKDIIRNTNFTGLHVAPATGEMENLKNSKLDGYVNIISSQVSTLDYDYIFIDCPPDLNAIVDNCLTASTNVIVPIKIDNWSLLGFGCLMQHIQTIRTEYNPNLDFTGAFITMDKPRTQVSKQVKIQLHENLQDNLLKTCIRDNATLITSTFYEKPVVIFDKNCSSAKDYFTLSDELFKKLLNENGGK